MSDFLLYIHLNFILKKCPCPFYLLTTHWHLYNSANTSMHILSLIPDDPFNKLAHIFLTVNEASGWTDFFPPSQPRSVQSYKKTYYSAQCYHDNHSQSLMWCFGNFKKGVLWESPNIRINNKSKWEWVSMNLQMYHHVPQKSQHA